MSENGNGHALTVTEPTTLTAKEARFVEEYFVDLCGTRAAIRAGYSPTSAAVTAHANLRKPKIMAAIDARIAELSKDAKLRTECVLQELARVAYADIGDILDFSGVTVALRPAREIPIAARRAIRSMKVKRVLERDGTEIRAVEVTDIQLHDKLQPLITLLERSANGGNGRTIDDMLKEFAQRRQLRKELDEQSRGIGQRHIRVVTEVAADRLTPHERRAALARELAQFASDAGMADVAHQFEQAIARLAEPHPVDANAFTFEIDRPDVHEIVVQREPMGLMRAAESEQPPTAPIQPAGFGTPAPIVAPPPEAPIDPQRARQRARFLMAP